MGEGAKGSAERGEASAGIRRRIFGCDFCEPSAQLSCDDLLSNEAHERVSADDSLVEGGGAHADLLRDGLHGEGGGAAVLDEAAGKVAISLG